MDQSAEVTWTQRAYLSFDREVEPPYTPSQLDAMAFDPDQITELVGLSPQPYWYGPARRNFASGPMNSRHRTLPTASKRW